MKLGELEFHIVSDGSVFFDGGAMFGVIPKTMWEKKCPADSRNRIELAMNCLLIRAGGKRILVETGAGDKLSPKLRDIYGLQGSQLLMRLRDYGVAPKDIDIVINTHLHFDHCGWNTVRDQGGKIVPTFPRAKYYAPEGEWQYARRPSERDAISYIPDNYDPLVQSGQMTLLKGGEEIVPGISAKTFPGHTAHMQAVIVESGGRTACYISDLIPTTAHIDLTWGMAFDLYPLQTIESKKQYYAKAIAEKWLTVFTHDPKVPWAYVEKEESGKMMTREPALYNFQKQS
jgi:glyoxylase-like metal-dependent hydrolase (beta-lactamase superfamily II)